MISRQDLSVWLSAILVSMMGWSVAVAAEYPLPTEMCRTYMFVPLTLADKEGRPSDRTLHMLYDTGASATFIDPDSLSRVTGERFETTRVDIVGATLGPLDVNRLPARLQQLDHISMSLGREIDGILAYDTFGDFLVVLDYPKAEIRLEEGSLPKPDGKTIFSSRGPDKRPWLEVKIGSTKRRLLIDSGSATSLSVQHITSYPTQSEPVEVRIASRLKRFERTMAARLTVDVRIGDIIVETPIIRSVPKTELLGGEILNDFVVTFDVRHKRVKFDQVTPGAIRIDSLSSLGLLFKPVTAGFEVVKVLPMAANLDVEVGDVIVAKNGIPMAERGCGDLAKGRDVVLTRERNGEMADIPLTSRVLVE